PQGNTPGTPVTVTGLTDGVSVSIRLRAVNDVGPGAPSLPVSVTPHPPTVPDAPINLSAVAGQGQATLSFTAPYDGGSAILRYEVRVGSGGTFAPANQAAPGSPITVTGLTNGVAVDLSVRAVNAVGAGAASTVSVTPVTPQPMVLVVDTNSGNPGSSVALPLSGAVDVTIDWGGSTANAPAGECPTTVQSSLSTTTRCTYDTPGQYTVQISGTLEGFGLGKWAGYALAEKIIKVTAWGSLNLQSLEAAFSPVSMIANSGIEEVPADFPATVTNLSYAFCKTSRFNQPLDTWDVSHVTLMEKTFSQSNFNASIADWDTRAVTSLWGFAMSNTVFNQPMDAHEVTRFGRTYTAWDVRNVTVFSFAFMGASAFNQTLEHWDTSAAQEFSMTFSQTGVFNQPINTNEVTVGGRTYLAWDVSKVTKMNDMFLMAKAFNQPLDAWNTSNVTTLANMFTAFGLDTMPFNQPLDTHEVTVGGQTYVAWNVGKVTDMSSMFGQSAFNQPLAHWDTRNVTTLASMFAGNKVFNQSLSPTTVNVGPLSYISWDTSKVTTLESMFVNARDFNGDVGLWDTSSVTNLNSVFSYATAFNQDLSAWNTANVTQMKSTFSFTNAFNQPLASWNTGKVTTMMQMFQGATAFNQPLGAWNTSQVTSMQSMFSGATSFAQDLSTWCVALISGSPGNQSFSNNSPLAFTPAHLPNWGVACTP
ncbi:MAG: hypothetical protein RL653_1252, partial [Pseudomonadota bacterium]